MPSQEDINHQLKLLEIHRRNLKHYTDQQAIMGVAFTPPHVTHGIREAYKNIRQIKAILKKWGVSFEDLDTDKEPPQASPQP